jgi:DNA adenine methylase
MLKPIFKYSGGKSKELKFINTILPNSYERIIEPFVGGGAFFLSNDKPAIINDNNPLVINFYKVVSDTNLFSQLMEKYNNASKLGLDNSQSKEQLRSTSGNLCNLYYEARSCINKNNSNSADVELAFSFLVVRQLAFSGMHRQDKNGNFNVPFGWYKKLSSTIKQEHHNKLKDTQINFGSFEESMKNLIETDFIFLDPPYLERAGYKDTTGTTSEELHIQLNQILKNTKAKWMVIHTDIPLYRELYSGYNFISKDFNYSQRFGKDKDHSSADTKHIYITNY